MSAADIRAFRARYEEALKAFLAKPGETSLERAYELGRSASAVGIGILEITQIHVDVMQEIFSDLSHATRSFGGLYGRAQAFLMECLAPHELAYRGFRDANASLRRLIAELEHANAQLTEAKTRISAAHKREEFLASASWRFSMSLDQREIVREILEQSVARLSFACLIELACHVPEHHQVEMLARDMRDGSIVVDRHTEHAPQCLCEPGAAMDEAKREAIMASVGKRFSASTQWTLLPLTTNRAQLGNIAFVMVQRVEESFVKEFVSRASTALDNARLYKEAEDAIRAREEMLGIVAHDLRNPLSSLKLSTELVSRLVGMPSAEARIRAQSESMRRGIKRIEILVEDIMDLARIEAGTLQISLAECRVGTLIEDALAMMRPLADKKGVQLKSQVLCSSEVIECDLNRILQVFSNLIGNAIKFTAVGGCVTVRAKLLEQSVLFSILDTGGGIPADQLPHIFDRLWQAKPGVHAGIGFGLYISRMIVQAHGGAICPDSVPGKGSSFFFTLPLPQTASQRRGKAA